eukprot:CAMPEP_0198362136 /NCGR_PEP_ID=MMETSP1450-20131203/144910_1 /TAXON_ID=753684 ORGANISM="Madagascaria erythrocladiodes, Strain CCMP3234" /NCGR_SAMPLE_ID=MMETSP1450 /ASSEMBLY_ACC=CAM_ASM_001115 /LENGTH=51 /DNA_ID=CAMNT_0044069317 /DNA_START=1 /DNA_END=152 /DNA_ORIENTATION=-
MLKRQVKKYIRHDAAAARVHVDTVDKFQGLDKNVVFLSFVKSNAQHDVGRL